MNIRARDKGFTLIEILVVVTIIAIISSVAMLSINLVGTNNDSKKEAQRLASLIEIAQDEAMMQGREFGIELLASGYRFVEYDPFALRWVELGGDDTLRFRNLPDGLQLELFLEDKLIKLEEELAELPVDDDDNGNNSRRDSSTADDYAPHVLVYSSGDMTPFRLHLFREPMDEPIVLSGDFVGNVIIGSEDEF